MSNNQQPPESWPTPFGSQDQANQQYAPDSEAQQYPGQQQYPGADLYPGQQQYPGAGLYPGQQQYPGQQFPAYGIATAPAAPVRQTGKRIISMILLVVGYAFGGLFLSVTPPLLLDVLAKAGTESAGSTVGGIIGSLFFPGLATVLLVCVHRWRGRIKRSELQQGKY